MTQQKNQTQVATQAGAQTITVNVGKPGNIKKLVLDGAAWTVKDVLAYSGMDASGYDIRVNGQPGDLNSTVIDGQTVLLLVPIAGN